MTIKTRKTIIDLSEEEKNGIAQTIAILRGLESADLCEDEYEELVSGIYLNLNDMAEALDSLLTNISDCFTPTKENTDKTSW